MSLKYILSGYMNSEKKVTKKVHISQKRGKNVGSFLYFRKKGETIKTWWIRRGLNKNTILLAKCEMPKNKIEPHLDLKHISHISTPKNPDFLISNVR